MQYTVVPQTEGFIVHITDGRFHYQAFYPEEPPEEHKEIHLARAREFFAFNPGGLNEA